MPSLPSRVVDWLRKAVVGPVSYTGPSATYGNSPALGNGGWFPVLREGFAGAWQRNITFNYDAVLSSPPVWTVSTLIAHDISKLRLRVIRQQQPSGIWQEEQNAAYSPLLRDPNNYQNCVQFIESWIFSKLHYGNTYVLKRRDGAGIVRDLYILDPSRVRPMVGPDSSIFYQLHADDIAGVEADVVVPAREMIHDRWNCIRHRLVGVSPLFAAMLPAMQGLAIQQNSAEFFHNRSKPGGILTAPGHIDRDTADRLSEIWDENYSGPNAGRVAIVGDGLQYQAMTISAEDSQLIEQLKLSYEMVCHIFHVPLYKAGFSGATPPATGIEPLNNEYYATVLQKLIVDLETCLDRGLNLAPDVGIDFDLDDLVRMDQGAKVEALRKGVEASILAPNEARFALDKPPVTGGELPLSQEQYWNLSTLAGRQPPAPRGPNAPPVAERAPPASVQLSIINGERPAKSDGEPSEEPGLNRRAMPALSGSFLRQQFRPVEATI